MGFYKVRGVGRGIDGLVVEAVAHSDFGSSMLYEVKKWVNRDAVFGDRELSFPIEPYSMYLVEECLEKIDDAPREYEHRNTNGKYVGESRRRRDSVEVVCVEFENALSVSVLDMADGKVRVVYSQEFRDPLLIAAVKRAIESSDFDDLPFALGKIKEVELEQEGSVDRG